MAVTIEITQRGVYHNGDMVPVGEKLTLESEPTGWVNKYRVVNTDVGKRMEVATPEQEERPKRRGRPRKSEE